MFVTTLQSVRDRLGDVKESRLDAVLAKFKSGRIRLADLTDDELRMLREDGSMADQLYLDLQCQFDHRDDNYCECDQFNE